MNNLPKIGDKYKRFCGTLIEVIEITSSGYGILIRIKYLKISEKLQETFLSNTPKSNIIFIETLNKNYKRALGAALPDE